MKQHIGKQESIKSIIELYAKQRNTRHLREKLSKGYQEMAKINLEIAEEWFDADNNTQENYENQLVECE